MVIFNEHDQNSTIVVSFDESSFCVNVLGDKNYQFSIKFQQPQNPTWMIIFNEHDQNSTIGVAFDESSSLINILDDKKY